MPPQTEAVVTLYNFVWMDSHMLPVEAFATGIKILSAKLPKRLQTEQMELSILFFLELIKESRSTRSDYDQRSDTYNQVIKNFKRNNQVIKDDFYQ